MDIKQRYFEKIISKLQRVTKNLDFLNEINASQFEQSGGADGDVNVTNLSNALMGIKGKIEERKAEIKQFIKNAKVQIKDLKANINAVQNRVNIYARFVNKLVGELDITEEEKKLLHPPKNYFNPAMNFYFIA